MSLLAVGVVWSAVVLDQAVASGAAQVAPGSASGVAQAHANDDGTDGGATVVAV